MGRFILSVLAGTSLLLGAAYTNPSKMWFTANGSGATKRLVSDKLGDVVSVKDFGAVGDGVADDTAAINAAKASVAANGGTVFFPPGTYKACITVQSNVRLLGSGLAGTALSCANASWAVDFSDASNAGIESMTISIGATALGGLRIRGNALTSETREVIRDVAVTAGVRTAGQIGFILQSDTVVAGVYHNVLHNVSVSNIDIGIRFVSLVGTQGPNGNSVNGFRANGHSRAIQILDGSENVFNAVSILGGTASPVAIQIGGVGNGGYCAGGNTITGLVSEQGAGSTTVSVASAAGCVTLANQSNIIVGYPNDITQVVDSSAGSNQFLFGTGVLLNGGSITTTGAISTTGTATDGTLKVTSSVSNDGGGHKHIRIQSCTTAATAGATCATTVTWTTAFANIFYTVACGLQANAGQPRAPVVTALSATGLTVQIEAATAVGAAGVLHCIADHD